ncbi:MAG: hypothetical protein ABEJ98_04705 [Candidatus Nanohaloarchaea archaeon]
MEDKKSLREFYEDIETVAEGFLEEDGNSESIAELLEDEFREISYPVRKYESSTEHVRTSFGLSFLVAERFSEISDREYFFDERAEDFREFYENVRINSQNYGKNELIQFANLYSTLAEEEGLEPEYSTESLVLQDKSQVESSVKELLDGLADHCS